MKKKGIAMGVALGVTAGLFVVSLGATAVVLKTNKENTAVEGSQMSYFAAERGIEYALFDVSGHLPGYQVEKDNEENYGKLKTEGKETQTEVVVESREKTSSSSVSLPVEGKGSAASVLVDESGKPYSDADDWNMVPESDFISIPLYIDNTGN